MTDKLPAGLFCPVCGRELPFIWVWREPASERIRVFCDDCAHLDEYRLLPKQERVILSLEGFQRFAARRLLAHIWRKERVLHKTGDDQTDG